MPDKWAPWKRRNWSCSPIRLSTHTSLIGTDVLSGKLARDPGSVVGSYPITLGTLSAGQDYVIDFTSAIFKILPLPVTDALAVRPVAAKKSTELSVSIPKALAAPAQGTGSGLLGIGAISDGTNGLSVNVLLPGAASVSVNIFDNLGNPVISFAQDVDASQLWGLDKTSDSRWILPVSWNLRASNGIAVQTGVYLWKIDVLTTDGQKLETVKKLGVNGRN